MFGQQKNLARGSCETLQCEKVKSNGSKAEKTYGFVKVEIVELHAYMLWRRMDKLIIFLATPWLNFCTKFSLLVLAMKEIRQCCKYNRL